MSKGIKFFLYLVLIFTVYATGSIFLVSYYYNIAVVSLLVTAVIFKLFAPKSFGINISSNAFLLLLVLPLLILMTISFNFNEATKYSPYLAIIMQIYASYFIASSIAFEDFKRIYVNIMTVLALISLFCFAIVLFKPTVMLSLPKISGSASVDYYNAFVYVFCSSKGFGSFSPFTRNNGIFWGPGAYQAFLNIALLFLLENSNVKNRKDSLKLFILIAAILTTFSTTGYIIMFLIIIFRFSDILKIVKVSTLKTIAALFLLTAVVIFISKSEMSGFMSDKLNTEFGEEGNFINRIYLNDLAICFEHFKNALFGISFESYAARGLKSGNSIVQTMVCTGIPFTLILLAMYSAFCKKISRHKFLCFIILLMIFSTESLLWRPLFLCMAWYGVASTEEINIKYRIGYKNE